MKNFFLLVFLIGGLIQIGFSDFQVQEKLFVPWGSESGHIPLKEMPTGWLSVESFEVSDENIYLLTSNSGQILIFDDQNLVSIRETGITNAKDFQLDTTGELQYIMDSQVIYDFQGQTPRNVWVNTLDMQTNSRFLRGSPIQPAVLVNLSETILPMVTQSRSTSGLLNYQEEYGRMIRQSGTEMVLMVNNIQLAILTPEQGTWGSGQYLGVNSFGDHYILLETILEHFPVNLRRELRIIDPNGQSVAAIELPDVLHVSVTREFQINRDGAIHELITSAKGVHILEWKFSGSHPQQFIKTALPDHLSDIQVRSFTGDSTLPHPKTPDEKTTEAIETTHRFDFPPVERETSLSIGAEYVDLIWTATSENLTNGQINDPSGNVIQTPDWIQIGQNQKMAYKWGGFSTIDGYVSGLASGKYAGDMATSAVSSYAVGVDCSGFVSRCWNMPQHYSTWMMSNTQPLITLPYSSWYDLLPGDAIHKVGHVRLAVLWNTNGTILAVEAGGGWITHYQSYSISQLAAYQPRYYINIEGMPATIEQPLLGAVCGIDSSIISWTLADTSGISGIHIYQRNLYQTDAWESFNIDPIPVEQVTYPLPNTDLSIAYQLRSVSANNNDTESYPSDSYAFAAKGSPEKLLIVDGFDRTTGSYPFPYHNFSLRMAEALGRFRLSYETVDNDAILSGLIQLEDYQAVFWLLGDESTLHESFSDQEQGLVEAYLTQGGKLFVSGSEIAWDLDSQGSGTDQAFFHNFLKTEYDADDSESYTISGESGTPFAELVLNFDDGNDGVYEENYPDAYRITGGSEVALRYANNMIAATTYTGTFGSGTATGQVILLGIPFETIYRDDQRLALTTSILEYFELSTTLPVVSHSALPVNRLLKPFPSPFNNTAQVQFELEQAGNIDLRVYDLRGREVALLSQEFFEAGYWQLPFHAEGLPGGIYLIQLRTGDFLETQKIIYLK